jgi:hypothetical protein
MRKEANSASFRISNPGTVIRHCARLTAGPMKRETMRVT